MHRIALTLLSAGLGLSLAATAAGQPGLPGGAPPDPNLLFNRLDRNGDGLLTAAELPNFNTLPPQIRAVLSAADRNGDGAISREEFLGSFPGLPGGNGLPNGPPNGNGPANANGPPNGNGPIGGGRAGFGPGSNMPKEPPAPIKTAEMDKLFRRLDENHDNKLTTDEIPQEYRDTIERLMATGDKDKDGALSKAEFRDALKNMPEAGDELGEMDPKFMFQQMDVNHDGRVTTDEVPAAHRALFERLLAAGDKDGDGALSKREFGKAASQSQMKSAAALHKPAPKKKSAAGDDAAPDAK